MLSENARKFLLNIPFLENSPYLELYVIQFYFVKIVALCMESVQSELLSQYGK